MFGTTTFDDSVDSRARQSRQLPRGRRLAVATTTPAIRLDSAEARRTHFIVFGYSQSAVVASLVKNRLIEARARPGLDGTEFYLISNPMRPNGGILGRGFEGMTIPIIGITFYGPTQNSCPRDPCTAGRRLLVSPTVDVAQQYDFLGGDAPARPLNALAMANSIAAYALLHGNVPNQHASMKPRNVSIRAQYGDTHYYMITAPTRFRSCSRW